MLRSGLSFSGIYDDGWAAEVARIQLGSENKAGKIRIKGEVPGFNRLRGGTIITVLVDGQEVARASSDRKASNWRPQYPLSLKRVGSSFEAPARGKP